MMGYIKILILALLAILGILLVVQNLDSLTQEASLRLNFYFWEGKTDPYPVYLLIMLAFLLGVFLTSLLGFSDRIRIRRSFKEAERKKNELEKEIASLRKLSYNLANQPEKSGSSSS